MLRLVYGPIWCVNNESLDTHESSSRHFICDFVQVRMPVYRYLSRVEVIVKADEIHIPHHTAVQWVGFAMNRALLADWCDLFQLPKLMSARFM